MSPSDLACLDTGNRIMQRVFKLARQCQRFHVPWAIENPENSLCWTTPQLQELSKMRNVAQNDFRLLCFWYQMAKTYKLFWPATWTRLTYGLWTPCAVVGTNDAVLRVKNTCNSLDMTPFINAHVHIEAECTLRNWQADLQICF